MHAKNGAKVETVAFFRPPYHGNTLLLIATMMSVSGLRPFRPCHRGLPFGQYLGPKLFENGREFAAW
jgi:hypothetical protein